MAQTATTLSGAIGPSDWIISLASMGALKPNDNIVCQQESMKTLVVLPGAAIVFRGSRGTNGASHASGAAATYGSPSDYGVGIGVTLLDVGDHPLVLKGLKDGPEPPTEEIPPPARMDAKREDQRGPANHQTHRG